MLTEMNRNFVDLLPNNLAANIAYFQTNVVIAILLLLYFISILGAAAYEFFLLAISITGYVAIIVPLLNTAISRYLTIHSRREHNTVANGSYSKAIYINFRLGSKKCVLSHSDKLKVTVPDTENCTSSIPVVHRVVKISSFGVA